MRHDIAIASALLLTVSACATSEDTGPTAPPPMGPANCNADAVQDLVGQTASQSLAATAMERSGADTLRWIPPNSAVTMDFRAERLNISYDQQLVVADINCG